jgi:T5SS/PEP-CTERM-associated repeat protein
VNERDQMSGRKIACDLKRMAFLSLVIFSSQIIPAALAQYSSDYQTNIISGVTSNWNGTYSVGHSHTFLQIDSSGALIDTSARIENSSAFGGLGNGALVTGSGSVWSNQNFCDIGHMSSGNTLTVSAGGQVFAFSYSCPSGALGSSNNFIVVTGSNSVLSAVNQIRLNGRSTLVISNGGAAIVWSNLYVGGFGGGNNTAIITGAGSFLSVSNQLMLCATAGSYNAMLISDGAQVSNSYTRLGDFGSDHNCVLVTGSNSLWSIDQLDVGSLGNPLFAESFNNSLAIHSNATVVASNVTVGANNSIELDQGSLVLFRDFAVRNNATVSGCGTVSGTVNVSKGGTVLADCDGELIFMNSVTNNGTMWAINGGVLECYGAVVNNGTIDFINGSANFHGAFINNGVVLDSNSVHISSITLSEPDVIVQIPSATGHTYQLQTSPVLSPANWTNICPAQAGIDSVLIFTDLGGVTNDPTRFYRIVVTAP